MSRGRVLTVVGAAWACADFWVVLCLLFEAPLRYHFAAWASAFLLGTGFLAVRDVEFAADHRPKDLPRSVDDDALFGRDGGV